MLSPHRRIELRVVVLIWLSSVVWSTGIIGGWVEGGKGGTGGGAICDGLSNGDKTVESIAEWLSKIKRKQISVYECTYVIIIVLEG